MNSKAILGASVAIGLIAGACYVRGVFRTRPLSSAEAALSSGGSLAAPEPRPADVSPAEFDAKFASLMQTIPTTRYDMTAMAGTLGTGIEPSFAFVRDHIRYEAYSGVLRGDEHTFLARAGNAFDRSLLLASLLKLKGVPTRFASGRLAAADTERLFARMFEATRPEQAHLAPKAAAAPGATAFLARVIARGRRDYSAIRAALGQSLPSTAIPSRQEVLQEIEPHVWVQAQVDDQWVDLDSAFGDATPGRAYCTVDNTFDEIPPESYQRVIVRVASETLTDDQLATQTVLEIDLPASDLLDKQIFLLHTPAGAGALGGLGGSAKGGTVWAPVLWVDGEAHAGDPIDFSNEGSTASGGFGLFGGGSGSPSTLVAESLEFESVRPDGHHDITRRVLVDRAGPTWRRAPDAKTLRALAYDDRGPLAPQALHNIWFSAGRHDLAAYSEALMQLVSGQDETAADGSAAPQPSFGEEVWPLALQNFAFLLWSDHFIVPMVNDSPSIRLYADSPRILMFTLGPQPASTGGGAYGMYDLRRDYLRGVARDASAERSVAERKVLFGALEGALEHEGITRDTVFSGNDPSVVASTSSLFTGKAVAFRPADVSRGASLATDPETAARMAAALSRGNSLVVPDAVPRGGRAGWWEIAGDGNTRAVLDVDLNLGYTTYRQPGISRGFSQSVHHVDPKTGRSFRESPYSQKRVKRDADKEYGEVVKAVAMTVLESGVVMWIAHYLQTKLNQSMAALDGASLAEGAGQP